MKHTLFLAPTRFGVGLTSTALGLVRAIDRVGLRVAFCKPFAQMHTGDTGPERSTHLIRKTTQLRPPTPLDLSYAEELLGKNQKDRLMEEVIGLFQQSAEKADVVIIEGLVSSQSEPFVMELNKEIARSLDAEIVLVGTPMNGSLSKMNKQLENIAKLYGGPQHHQVIGAIINKLNAPVDSNMAISTEADEEEDTTSLISPEDILARCKVFEDPTFRLLGTSPWKPELNAFRMSDVASALHAEIINEGAMQDRRVHDVLISARTITNLYKLFRPHTLVIAPGDRVDIIIGACMAALNGVPLAGLLLTCGEKPTKDTLKFCRKAIDTGLPILSVTHDSYRTANLVDTINTEVAIDDVDRMELVMDQIAAHIDAGWLHDLAKTSHTPRLSPPAFRYMLARMAAEANKRIVLPEGDEPRTLQAAQICHARGIARCILLGDPEKIQLAAEANGVELPKDIEILDPEEIRPRYVQPMVELRKHKGLNEILASSQLEDNVVLGTMMLQQGHVDGLVSGATHTTASTVRPALQLIKTVPDAKKISSVFFMCLPEQVVLYGDCAINTDPTVEELAEIAVQSAESAIAFGLPARVAMISYSTGASGTGDEVEKVREATQLAREMRPDLMIDGPLQYDAAAIESVALSKAPDSPIAGKATVFIFPDLNTGNTTYKAVQRSANVISIGPMLQGLRKPVNDLSRGALVDDIVYTIALTAIQARQAEERNKSPRERNVWKRLLSHLSSYNRS